MSHPRPSSEEIYDTEVSPLVKRVLDICRSTSPMIPIATCSSFWSDEHNQEGSCSSFVAEKSSCSLRMEQIGACAMNKGRPPMSINARFMTGGGTDFTPRKLDAKWYKANNKHHEAMGKIAPLLMQIKKLVDETHSFPTAIVVQTPNRGFYTVIGKLASTSCDGIQYMRVIAEHGYTKQAASLLMGVGLGNPEHDSMFSMISQMQELNGAKKKGGIRGVLKAARDQQIQKNIQESEEAWKRGKVLIPNLRVGEGYEEELDAAVEEERRVKIDVKVKQEASEKRKREKTMASVSSSAPRKKKRRKSSKKKKRRRGVNLNWEAPSRKKEKDLARQDREKLMHSLRKKASDLH